MRYAVIAEVGHGGMGRVLRAYDPKLQREVALKEVRRETLGPVGATRLVAEARAMAKLSHPNVVAVYDVEERDDGEVVIVMEYVAGRTITRWLDVPRSWQEILACFRRAGRGLAAAHAVGLLHRDFKPDNVLVGDDGRVRVTDFGLAREIVTATTDEPAERRTSTATVGSTTTTSGAIVGTLPYLAPERLMGAPADPATDQFAFCVALWEALFGARPFAGSSIGELAFAMSAGPPRAPASSKVPARVLVAILRGLATDAQTRWPDMPTLLDALGQDPSQRRRRALQLFAGIGAVGIAIAGVQAWASARAQRCSEDAAIAHLQGAWDDARRGDVERAVLAIDAPYSEGVWTRSEPALDAYASAWTQMHVETCAATTVRGEQSEAVMDLRMACLQRARVELAAVTEVLGQADVQTVQKAHELIASLRPLARCSDIEALQAEIEPPLPEEADAVEALRTELARIRAELRAGRFEDARRALADAEAVLGDIGYAPVQAEVALVRGEVLVDVGDYPGARDALREALRLAASSRQPNELRAAATLLLFVVGYDLQRFDEALRYADIARALTDGDPQREADVSDNVAVVLETQGKHARAEQELRRALALREQVPNGDELDRAGTLGHLGGVLNAEGKHAEAEATHREVLALQEEILGPEHPRVATTRNNLAADLHAQGKLAEAEAEHRRVLALRERALGPHHVDVAQSHNNLAGALYYQRKFPEAEAEYRTALALRELALGDDHPLVAQSHFNLSGVLAEQGRLAEAETELWRAVTQQDAQLGEHPNVALSHHNLGQILRTQGKYAEADVEYRKALALREKLLGPDHADTAESHHGLANTLFSLGELEAAETEHRRALAIWEKTLGADHPFIAMSHANLARVLLDRGEIAEARRLAESAAARFAKDDIDPAWRTETAFVLARVCWASGERGDRRRAIELAEGALASHVAAGAADGKDAAEVRAWLAEHRVR
jgi:eukaryotic-like serine/threonine-protein kinase